MNTYNLMLKRTNYPTQSFASALAAPTNQQLVMHSISAYNGTGSAMDIAIGHALNATKYISGFSGSNYVFQATRTFGLLSFNLSAGDTSGATFGYEYSTGPGTWAPLTRLNTSPVLTSTGQKNILFNPPIGWAKDSQGYFSVRITGTATPNFVMNGLKFVDVWAFADDVPAGAALQVNFKTMQKTLQQAEDIIPFFAVASDLNVVESSYQLT